MRLIIAALALAAAAPALAQTAAAPPAPVAADPARMAAAKQVIELVWPLGSLKRIMEGSMAAMREQGMKAAMGLKLGDMLDDKGKAAVGEATVGDMAKAADPHFEERLRITNDVMMREMVTLMAREEPAMRTAMVGVYARRFTTAELGDMRRFFETPTGRKYAAEALTMMQDPELVAAMQGMLPRLMGEMPAIIKKVEAATAHLPPPPKGAGDEGEEEAEQEVIG